MRKIQNLVNRNCRIFGITLLICSLLLTGCGPTTNESGHTIPAATGSSTENPVNTEPPATAESTQATENTQTAESTLPTEHIRETDDSAAASLVALRQALVGTPQQFAVAYFGYALPDGNVPVNPYAVMEGAAPQLWDDLPFLEQIPAQNILGTEGNLFCIVPADENATVSVNWSPWDDATETFAEATVLYRSETGDPILLMTTNTGWCMETEVIITDSSGEVTFWYPFIDEDNRIASLCDENGVSLYYDFSPYDRLNYENQLGGAPIEMVGTWELAWTEAEGDRIEAAPGACTVEITTDGMDSFRIRYTDNNYPEDNFSDRELVVSPGELYPGCGNNQWFADVAPTSGERIHHAVTLLDDGTLLMQHSWEMDGMLWVSYGLFCQVS